MLDEARSADPPVRKMERGLESFHNINLFVESPQKLNPARLRWKSEHWMHCGRSPSQPIRTRSGTENPTKISDPEGSAALLRERELGTKDSLFSTFLVIQTPTPSNSAVPDPVCDSPSTQRKGLQDRMLPTTKPTSGPINAYLLHSCPMWPRMTYCTVVRVLRQEPLVVLNIREVQFVGVYTERLMCLCTRLGPLVCPGGQVDLGPISKRSNLRCTHLGAEVLRLRGKGAVI